jgi:hypothetical protein
MKSLAFLSKTLLQPLWIYVLGGGSTSDQLPEAQRVFFEVFICRVSGERRHRQLPVATFPDAQRM